MISVRIFFVRDVTQNLGSKQEILLDKEKTLIFFFH